MGRDLGLLGTASERLSVDTHAGDSSFVKILAIGSPDEWHQEGHAMPVGGQISFLSIHELSEETLNHFRPSVIYSPVLARGFDCIELAMLLNRIGFEGVYRAFATNLPKPEMIEREVQQMCRRFTFEIIQE